MGQVIYVCVYVLTNPYLSVICVAVYLRDRKHEREREEEGQREKERGREGGMEGGKETEGERETRAGRREQAASPASKRTPVLSALLAVGAA